MKYFVVFALCVAAASAFAIPPTVTGAEAAEIQQIIDAIYHPSTDPATAAALEEMLLEILGINKPIVVEDEIVHEDFPIHVGPEIIDDSIISEPANYRPPMVQVIINVKTNSAANAVVVEHPESNDLVVVEKPESIAPVVIPSPAIPLPEILN